MNTLLTAATVVAAVNPAEVKPGWLALVIVLLMGLATFLLWRSMNRQLKKVDFDEAGGPATDAHADAEPSGDDGPVPDERGGRAPRG